MYKSQSSRGNRNQARCFKEEAFNTGNYIAGRAERSKRERQATLRSAAQKVRKRRRGHEGGGSAVTGRKCTSCCVTGSAGQGAADTGERASGNEVIARDTARNRKKANYDVSHLSFECLWILCCHLLLAELNRKQLGMKPGEWGVQAPSPSQHFDVDYRRVGVELRHNT